MKRSSMMRCVVATFLGAAVLLAGGSAFAATLDDFSTNQYDTPPRKYNQYRHFGAGAADYEVTSGVLDPLITSGNTFGWMWNQGQTLNPGDTISVDVAIEAGGTQTGFRLSDALVADASTAPAFAANDPYFLLRREGVDTSWVINYNNTAVGPSGSIALTGTNTASQFVTLTIQRGTGAQQENLTVSASGNLTGSGTRTISGIGSTPLYFAMEEFSGGGANTGQFDNLTYTPVPEPAALGLIGLAAGGLLARRRRV